jgi:hypothetical protein
MKSTMNQIRDYPQYDADSFMPPPEGWMMLEPLCGYHIERKINEKYGLQSDIRGYIFGKARILEANIPAQIKRALAATVSVKIKGVATHAFITS